MLKHEAASLQQSTGKENHEVIDSRSRECGKEPGKCETVGRFEVNSGDEGSQNRNKTIVIVTNKPKMSNYSAELLLYASVQSCF